MPLWKRPPIPDPPESEPQMVSSRIRAYFRALVRPRMLITVAVLGFLAGLLATVSSWLPDLNQRPEYQVKTDLIKISPPPALVPQNFLNQVLAEADLPTTLSLLDPQLVPKIVEAFRKSPWVEQVVQVRKGYPSELTVELRYRIPVAMVRVRNGFYPVDPKGVVLPPTDFRTEEVAGYPQILNVDEREADQVVLGQPWNNPAVCEAAKLLTQLETRIREYHLIGVEIPPSGETTPFRLMTQGRIPIKWGRGPSSDHPGELSTRQKIGRLEDLVRRCNGNIDSSKARDIDITPWETIVINGSSTDPEGKNVVEKPEQNRRRN